MICDPDPMSLDNFDLHRSYLEYSIAQAQIARKSGEIPVGAVVVDFIQKKILSSEYNQRTLPPYNPCGHAEILALQAASKGGWRLNACVIYVTLEPCPMCLGAMVQSRIGGLVFGAYDKKGGAISLGYCLHRDFRLNHRFPVMGGVEEERCAGMLSAFFKLKRIKLKGI
ncbi:MAG: nucleoside deaminase [Oligoflexia bacterium]|nr:nucleoside deaminase [Oligoflexia bacterium]